MSRRKGKRGGDNVRVVARFRPFNDVEREEGSYDASDISRDHLQVTVELGTKKRVFPFDYIFSPDCTQEQVYERVGQPIVDLVFQGYNGTIFCYGQTGAGKTYTMMGPSPEENHGYCDDPVLKGLIPRVVEQVFSRKERDTSDILEITIQIQYVEIYMEKLRDLLDPRKKDLHVREDRVSGRGIYVDGATRASCSSVDGVFDYLSRGSRHRVTSSHRMNSESSRSHSVFVVVVNQKNQSTGEHRSGQLFLVDLAGSEKVKKTQATGLSLQQAQFINLSLTTLGRVIQALADKHPHIPYRESVLTRLLQDSLGGNAKTFLVINCSPASYNFEETLSTLRFGTRAKTIKNKARINREIDPKHLRMLLLKARETIKRQRVYIRALEDKLSAAGIDLPNRPSMATDDDLELDEEGNTDLDGGGNDMLVETRRVSDEVKTILCRNAILIFILFGIAVPGLIITIVLQSVTWATSLFLSVGIPSLVIGILTTIAIVGASIPVIMFLCMAWRIDSSAVKILICGCSGKNFCHCGGVAFWFWIALLLANVGMLVGVVVMIALLAVGRTDVA